MQLSQEEIRLAFIRAKMAIKKNNYDEMKRIVESFPECINNTSTPDGTLLHTAAAKGSTEMIEYLVEKKSDINRIENEWSPICYAVSKKKIDNVEKLIELGAELNGKTSVNNPLIVAIYDNSIEISKILIDAGIDLTYQFKSKENSWWDTLSYAKYYERNEIVQLIENKLDKNNMKIENIKHEINKNKYIKKYEYFEDYIEDYLGPIEYVYSNEELLETFWNGKKQVINDVEIEINVILPKGKNYLIFITSGMSAKPMAEDANGIARYAEVMIKLPRNWIKGAELLINKKYNWPLKILSKTAYLGHINETGYISEKVIIPYGIPGGASDYFDWDKDFTSVMLCKAEDIPSYEIDENTKIDFFSIIPISEEEEILVKEKGSNAVKQMLSNGEIVDMEREYLLK